MDADRLGLETAFRGLIEQSPFSTQIHTADGVCVFVNHAWEHLWGVTLEHIRGYNILEDQQLVDKGIMPYVRRAFAGETVAIPPIKYEPELTRPGASAVSFRWITAYMYPIVNADGRVTLVAMTGEDVTARIEAEAQLREAEEQYRGIFEATGEGLVIVDEGRTIVEANPAFCRMHGCARGDLIGRHAAVILHPERRPFLDEAARSIEERGVYQTQGLNVRRDGASFPVEVHATRITYRGRPHVLSVVRDVSERVQAYEMLERRVAERTRELATLLEISHTVASTLELQPLLDLILAQLKVIVDHEGASVNSVEGDSIVVLHRRGPGSSEHVGEHRFPLALQPATWAMISRGEPVIVDDVYADTPLAAEFRAVYGFLMDTALSYLRAWMGVPLMLQERVIGTLALGASVPGAFGMRQAALVSAIATQAAVAIENARLYARAQELAALEERQRLARELHDSVSQALYGVALGARTARTLLDRDPTKLAEPLDYVLSLAQAGLAEMRALIFELRPEALETEGLVAALGKQVEVLRARHGLVVRTDFGVEPEASFAAKEALYRIAQEALHNAVKHAQAGCIEVRLAAMAGVFALEVADDGVGFDPHVTYPGHLGLHTMRERAGRLGGTLDLVSAPGEGTRLRVQIPIDVARG